MKIEKDKSVELIDEEEGKHSEILNTDTIGDGRRKKKPAAKLLGMDDNELENSL